MIGLWLLLLVGDAPWYSEASIVNAASNQAAFAPNTFVTIYGTGLAYSVRALAASDLHGDQLPTVLGGTGVRVFVNNIAVPIYYVSPTQINFLIPTNLLPGPAVIQTMLDAVYGPAVRLTVTAVAPALFQVDAQTILGAHLDGRVLTVTSPATPAEYITLYATGLGETVPRTGYAEIPAAAAWLRDFAAFSVLIDGVPLPRERLLYAGVAPGFAGLYQINIRLPDSVGNDPEVRLVAGEQVSPANLRIPLRQPPAEP